MNSARIIRLAAGLALGAAFATAGSVNFTCAANVDTTQAGTCAYLQNTVAGYYNNTFTNANANIYVQFGTTGLAGSTTVRNFISYSEFVNDLTDNYNISQNAVQGSALTALGNVDAPSYYGSSQVKITSANGQALGVAAGQLSGLTAAKDICTIGTAGCYDGVITATDVAGKFYFDQTGGTIGGTQYDFYSAIQHEVDEVLGTGSCINTTGANLADPCDTTLGGDALGTPSSTDLYRYNSSGNLALNSPNIGQGGATAGAYFSFDGGASNGASGFLYNTISNGDDYADFVNACPAGPFSVQDAEGCPGHEQGETILNDGGAETRTLNAIGYNLIAPEPGTFALAGFAMLAFGAWRRRRS